MALTDTGDKVALRELTRTVGFSFDDDHDEWYGNQWVGKRHEKLNYVETLLSLRRQIWRCISQSELTQFLKSAHDNSTRKMDMIFCCVRRCLTFEA